MSKFKKGHVITQEVRDKISKTLTGTSWGRHSTKTKKLMSKKMKGNTSAKGIPKSDEWKEKARLRMKLNNPMYNKNTAERVKLTKIKKGWTPSINYKDTLPERLTEAELIHRGIFFTKQTPICGYFVDFYLPEYRIIIECDGDYWHNLPDVAAKDIQKNSIWQFQGFKVYRFWEHEIKESISNCIDRITEL